MAVDDKYLARKKLFSFIYEYAYDHSCAQYSAWLPPRDLGSICLNIWFAYSWFTVWP